MDKVICHIENGGAVFSVLDEYGPAVDIRISHFGHTTNHIRLMVSKEVLKQLGEMFLGASEANYNTEDYCIQIKPLRQQAG